MLASVSVTTAVKEVLAVNLARRGLFIKSLAANTVDVYLKFDNSTTVLTTANGYPLSPGESIFIGSEIYTSGNDAPFTVQGITASGTVDLRVHEL